MILIRLILLTLFMSNLVFAHKHPHIIAPTFMAAEHQFAGDQVSLLVSSQEGKPPLLTLPNGLKLSYGSILLMPDFYGLPKEPISRGHSNTDRERIFRQTFDSFANNNQASIEIPKILNVVASEQQILYEEMATGKQEATIYEQHKDSFDAKYNCITGGNCNPKIFWLYPGRYMALMLNNVDHFGESAFISYQVGHDVAIKTAIEASQSQDQLKLQLAYAMNAFASHFLSDRFASGHMRVPRQQLIEKTRSSLLGGLIAGFMHNEENYYGLHVHNQRGDNWMAYGDAFYFDPLAQTHVAQQFEALQRSADDITYAYLHGLKPQQNSMDELIPYPDESVFPNSIGLDVAPLVYWDEKKQQLMRRADLKNPYDRRWTARWDSISTIFKWLNGNTLAQAIKKDELPKPMAL